MLHNSQHSKEITSAVTEFTNTPNPLQWKAKASPSADLAMASQVLTGSLLPQEGSSNPR